MAGLTEIKANSASQQSWSWSWSLAELKLRIYNHRRGGVMGWMKFKISQLGHALGLGLS